MGKKIELWPHLREVFGTASTNWWIVCRARLFWGAGTVVAGFAIGWIRNPQGWSRLLSATAIGLAGLGLLVAVIFLFQLIIAPSRIHGNQAAAIAELTSEVGTLQETIRSYQNPGVFDPRADLWDVLLYILNHTGAGVGKKESQILELLQWSARDAFLRVVAFDATTGGRIEIEPLFLRNHEFSRLSEDAWGIIEPQSIPDQYRKIPPTVHYRFPKFDHRQVEKLWPKGVGSEFNQSARRKLLEGWQQMVSDIEHWLVENPHATASELDAHWEDHPLFNSFAPYYKTRDISLPVLERRALPSSPPEHWVEIVNAEIGIIEDQWGLRK